MDLQQFIYDLLTIVNNTLTNKILMQVLNIENLGKNFDFP